jgi:hypothetical protein
MLFQSGVNLLNLSGLILVGFYTDQKQTTTHPVGVTGG